MVIGDHHDRFRPRGIEMRLHLAEEPRRLVRGVLSDLGRVMGRVGDTDAGNELSHSQLRALFQAGPLSRAKCLSARCNVPRSQLRPGMAPVEKL